MNEFLQPLEFFPDAEGYVSTTRYTGRDSEKTKHSIMALVWRYEDVFDEVIFQIVYSVDHIPGGRSGPFSHRESQFLTVVQALGEPSSLVASADFRFAGKTESDLWFPLPARLSGKTNETTIEVRGVRGSILANDDRSNYSFVLDRTANQDVTLNIRFDLHGEFEPAILRTTFARAVKAVPELVVL